MVEGRPHKCVEASACTGEGGTSLETRFADQERREVLERGPQSGQDLCTVVPSPLAATTGHVWYLEGIELSQQFLPLWV